MLGTKATATGPAAEQFRGRTCTYDFAEPAGSVLDTGSLAVTAWHGTEFFLPGTFGEPLPGIGDEAQTDADHGIVLFRSGEEVIQVQVLSPGRRGSTVKIAKAAAEAI